MKHEIIAATSIQKAYRNKRDKSLTVKFIPNPACYNNIKLAVRFPNRDTSCAQIASKKTFTLYNLNIGAINLMATPTYQAIQPRPYTIYKIDYFFNDQNIKDERKRVITTPPEFLKRTNKVYSSPISMKLGEPPAFTIKSTGIEQIIKQPTPKLKKVLEFMCHLGNENGWDVFLHPNNIGSSSLTFNEYLAGVSESTQNIGIHKDSDPLLECKARKINGTPEEPMCFTLIYYIKGKDLAKLSENHDIGGGTIFYSHNEKKFKAECNEELLVMFPINVNHGVQASTWRFPEQSRTTKDYRRISVATNITFAPQEGCEKTDIANAIREYFKKNAESFTEQVLEEPVSEEQVSTNLSSAQDDSITLVNDSKNGLSDSTLETNKNKLHQTSTHHFWTNKMVINGDPLFNNANQV